LFSKPFFSDSLARKALDDSRYTVGFSLHIAGIDRHNFGSKNQGVLMRDLDTKDREILEILSKEARIALKALAARIGLSRSATSERVINLERNGVIRGYRADIGEIDANVIRAILLVCLKRTPAISLLDLLAQNSQVRRVSSVSGQLDLVIEVESRTIDDLNRVRDAVASHESVEDITTAVVLRRDIDRQSS
jgi:DNA-binding Lrp family transcriptional regulator